MIEPTVGRVLYFYHLGESEPWAAIITKVHDRQSRDDDFVLNVVAFTPTGHAHPETDVLLVQKESAEVPSESHCRWMPYQLSKQAEEEPAAAEKGKRKGRR